MAVIEERRRHQKTEEICQPFPPTDLFGYQFGVVKNLSGRSQLQSVSDAIGEKLCVVQLPILVSQLLSLKHIELSTKIFTDEVIVRWLAELRPTWGGGRASLGLECAPGEAGESRQEPLMLSALFPCILKIFHN